MRRLLAALALLTLIAPAAQARSHPIRHGYGWYRITCYFATGSPTASGKWPRDYHTVAVDPRLIPLGAWVYISGVGWRQAEDTGGAVLSAHLDVFVTSWPEAYAIQGTGYRLAWWR